MKALIGAIAVFNCISLYAKNIPLVEDSSRASLYQDELSQIEDNEPLGQILLRLRRESQTLQGKKIFNIVADRASHTYIEGEKALFSLFPLITPTQNDFRVIPEAFFPDETTIIEVLSSGKFYKAQVEHVALISTLTAKSYLEHGQRVDSYKLLIEKINIDIEKAIVLRDEATLPEIQDYYQKKIDQLNAHKSALIIKISKLRLPLSTQSLALTITPNNAPIAIFEFQQEREYAPAIAHFNGENSHDSDGSIKKYTWDLGDGHVLEGKEVSHRYLHSGNYNVALTVTDDKGKTGSSTQQISFTPDTVAPELAFELPNNQVLITNTPIFNLSYSDNESGIRVKSFKIEVDGEDLSARATTSIDGARLSFSTDFQLANGEHLLSASIEDYEGNLTQKQLNVRVEAEVTLEGSFAGYVYDENGTPIEGATVTVSNGPVGARKQNVITNNEGRYFYQASIIGHYKLNVTKSGWNIVYKEVDVEEESVATVSDAVLRPVDSKINSISAQDGGVASNSLGNYTITIPPLALGENANFSITPFTSTNAFPGSLPELSQFTFAFEINPIVRSLYDQSRLNFPIDIADENGVVGFPVGTPLVGGVFDPDLGRWVDSGLTMTVGPDKTIEAIADGYISQLMTMDINQPSIQEDAFSPQSKNRGNHEKSDCPAGDNKCGSRINMESGNFTIDHALPAVTRFDENYEMVFSYNSMSAKPTILINFSMEGNDAFDEVVGAKAVFSFRGGVKTTNLDTTKIQDSYTIRALFDATFTNLVNTKSELPTGLHPYEVRISYQFTGAYATALYFGATPLDVISNPETLARYETKEPVSFVQKYPGLSLVMNEKSSPFGVGWTLNGLERLKGGPNSIFNQGSYLLFDGSGGAFVFNWLPTSPTGLDSRSRVDFSSLAIGGAPNIVDMHYFNGATYAADCENNLIYEIDLQGNTHIVAGNGERGHNGDEILATQASLNCPMGVFASEQGGFYIADSGNFRIRKVDSEGIIHTVAGNGKFEEDVDGPGAINRGIGRPLSISQDKLSALYFTTSSQKVRLITPRGYLSTYAAKEEATIEHDFKRPVYVSFGDFDRPIVVDRDKGEVSIFYGLNLKSDPIFNQDVQKNSSNLLAYKSAPLKYPTKIIKDPKLDRYYILDKNGKIYVLNDSKFSSQMRLMDLDQVQKFIRQGQKLKQVEESGLKVSAMAYSPEVGLILADEAGIRMNKLFNTKEAKEANTIATAEPQVVAVYLPPEGEYSFIEKLNNSQFRRVYPDSSYNTYDAQGRISARITPDARNTYYEYTDDLYKQIPTQITLPGGDLFKFSYSDTGFQVEDPAGRISTFEFNENRDVVSITNPDNSAKTFSYDADHLLQVAVTEDGKTEEVEYAKSRIVKRTLDGNRELDLIPSQLIGLLPNSDAPSPMLSKDLLFSTWPSKSGNCVEKTFQPELYIAAVENCLGHRTEYSHDVNGNETEVKSPEGRILSREFDEKGRVYRVAESASGTLDIIYDENFSLPTSITSASGSRQLFEYNQAGLLSRETLPSNSFIHYTYTPQNTLASIINPFNQVTSFEVDDNYNTSAIIDALSNRTEIIRNEAGQITQMSDALGRSTHFELDSMGRATKITGPRGDETHFTYTPAGQLLTLQDANNGVTSFQYHPDYQLVSSTTNPLNQSKQYFYNTDERLVGVTQEDGSSITFVRDLKGRITQQNSPDENIAFTYDKDNLPTLIQSLDSQEVREYDTKGRLKTSIQNGAQVDYTYNQIGKRSSMTYSKNSQVLVSVSYSYDIFDKLSQITATALNKTITWQRTRDVMGRAVEDLLPNGGKTQYFYDPAGRLSELVNYLPGGMILSKFMYSYNSAGEIVSIGRTYGGYGDNASVEQINYAYNLNGELTSSNEEAESWDYDLLGNRQGGSYSHNSANELLEDNKRTYSYNAKGEQIIQINKQTGRKEERAFNSLGQLKQIIIKKDGTNPSMTISNKFDGSGRRIEKEVSNLLNPTKSYKRYWVYDGEDIFIEFNQNDKLAAVYIHGEGIDDPIAMFRDQNDSGSFSEEEILSFTKNHLGSISELTDRGGKLRQRYRYSAFGEVKLEKTDDRTNEFTENPYAFTGREWDKETGLHYYRARYYSPTQGRFISRDPIGIVGGDYNLYRYVNNSVQSRKDSSGLQELLLESIFIQSYERGEPQAFVETVTPIIATAAVVSVAPIVFATAVHYTPILSAVIISNPQNSAEFASGFLQGIVEGIDNIESSSAPSSAADFTGNIIGQEVGKSIGVKIFTNDDSKYSTPHSDNVKIFEKKPCGQTIVY